MDEFWKRRGEEEKATKTPAKEYLSVANAKRLMKSVGGGTWISKEAPLVLCKAVELFVMDLTTRTLAAADDRGSKVVYRGDVHAAATSDEQFDFLLDTLPTPATRFAPIAAKTPEAASKVVDVSPEAVMAGTTPALPPIESVFENQQPLPEHDYPSPSQSLLSFQMLSMLQSGVVPTELPHTSEARHQEAAAGKPSASATASTAPPPRKIRAGLPRLTTETGQESSSVLPLFRRQRPTQEPAKDVVGDEGEEEGSDSE